METASILTFAGFLSRLYDSKMVPGGKHHIIMIGHRLRIYEL